MVHTVAAVIYAAHFRLSIMSLQLLSEIASIDNQLILWFDHLMFRWPILDRFLMWLLTANIVKFIPYELLFCWFWFRKTPNSTIIRSQLIELLICSFAALFFARFLALALPFRDRPFVNPELGIVLPFHADFRTWSSFPSDHAVMAFAFAASFYRLSIKLGILVLLHAVIVICLPRLYFALHYPSDLIGGGIIGVMLTFLIVKSKIVLPVSHLLLKIEDKYSGIFYALGFLILFEIGEMFMSIRMLVGGIFHLLQELLS